MLKYPYSKKERMVKITLIKILHGVAKGGMSYYIILGRT